MTAPASNHHSHSHTREASRRNLAIALGLTAGYMVVELIGGIMSNSLSLQADAGHMVPDAEAIGSALLATWRR